jgi:hypothetical protein
MGDNELPIIGYALRRAWSGGDAYLLRLHSETPKTAQATEKSYGNWSRRPSRVNKDDFLVRCDTEGEAVAIATAARGAWEAHDGAVAAAHKALEAAREAQRQAWRAAFSLPSQERGE